VHDEPLRRNGRKGDPVTAAEDYWDDGDYDEYDPDGDDYYDDDREPDEPDWGYLEWQAEYDEHCDEKHGGAACDCKPSLRVRVTDRLQRRIAAWRWRFRGRRHQYTDDPPF
jgi:hypothetical protein